MRIIVESHLVHYFANFNLRWNGVPLLCPLRHQAPVTTMGGGVEIVMCGRMRQTRHCSKLRCNRDWRLSMRRPPCKSVQLLARAAA
jgi:hypothetical protein